MSFCQNEIAFLKKERDTLLIKIQIHEQYLNFKEQNARLSPQDLIQLEELIFRYFRVLALTDTYNFFQMQNQAVVDENISNFLTIVDNRYLLRLHEFIKDLTLAVLRMH